MKKLIAGLFILLLSVSTDAWCVAGDPIPPTPLESHSICSAFSVNAPDFSQTASWELAPAPGELIKVYTVVVIAPTTAVMNTPLHFDVQVGNTAVVSKSYADILSFKLAASYWDVKGSDYFFLFEYKDLPTGERAPIYLHGNMGMKLRIYTESGQPFSSSGGNIGVQVRCERCVE